MGAPPGKLGMRSCARTVTMPPRSTKSTLRRSKKVSSTPCSIGAGATPKRQAVDGPLRSLMYTRRAQVRIEDLVQGHLDANETKLAILPEAKMNLALDDFVKKAEASAFVDLLEVTLKATRRALRNRGGEEEVVNQEDKNDAELSVPPPKRKRAEPQSTQMRHQQPSNENEEVEDKEDEEREGDNEEDDDEDDKQPKCRQGAPAKKAPARKAPSKKTAGRSLPWSQAQSRGVAKHAPIDIDMDGWE